MLENYFEIQELVDKPTFERLNKSSIWMLRPEAVKGLVDLRKYLNKPITVNDWLWGGNLSNRGYRSIESTVGGKFSQHRVGNAFDINVKGMSSDHVNEFIQENYYKFGITTLEDKRFTKSWTHIDWRYTGMKELLIVKP